MKLIRGHIAPGLVLLAMLVAALTVSVTLSEGLTSGSQATAQQAPPPAFRPASTATPVPASALVPHANPSLGYSVKLPPAYRRAVSFADSQSTGRDLYTPRSEDEDRALCAREQQDTVQAPARVADLKVAAYANPTGLSAMAFANAPERRVAFTSIVSTTVNGHEAAKVVHQPSGDTAYYVIAANDRFYEIAPMVFEQPTTQPKGWLDEIAASFVASPVQPGATIPSSPRSLCAP